MTIHCKRDMQELTKERVKRMDEEEIPENARGGKRPV
jgi:hypothetical protein